MKKIFALLFSLGTITTVFAQSNRIDESKDIVYGYPKGDVYDRNDRRDRNEYNPWERRERVERINREYDWRIERVKRDRYLRNSEKRRQIRFLERERDARIRQVWERSNNRNNDRDYKRHRRY